MRNEKLLPWRIVMKKMVDCVGGSNHIWEVVHKSKSVEVVYMEDVHERCDHLTTWLCSKIKKVLLVHWETNEEFRYRHLKNKANRASARSSKNTGGSTTFMKTKARLLKSLYRDATLAETFNGEDADDFVASVVDLDAVWRETASAPYKNRVYGLELFFTSSFPTSMLRPSSAYATSRAVDSEKGIDLRLQVQKLTHKLYEQVKELTDYRERYQEILTRVTDTDDLRLGWRE
ncbi:hypothetical protein Ahy_B03g063894 [Arachis hypogaea]|uniref:Uncharacterized protein n=1 Tax=Arachis hypogaea TaxID=3818 RepID=A0A444ZYC6_ARAHY|nr:hypothetical protein Ahy_B03g063894 [Arachis hypogaea]